MSGRYDYQSTTETPAVSTEMYSFSPSAESVSNYSDAVESGMTEVTGEDAGGYDASNDADGSGMSESSGSDTGGSDSGGSDGGGGDGGGGE